MKRLDRNARLKYWLLMMTYLCAVLICTYSLMSGILFAIVLDRIIRDKVFP